MWGRSERKKMQGTRPAAVAGLFYPDDTSALRITQRDGRAAAEWLRVAR